MPPNAQGAGDRGELVHADAEEATFSPVRPPRVAPDPVVFPRCFIVAVAGDGDRVIQRSAVGGVQFDVSVEPSMIILSGVTPIEIGLFDLTPF